MCNNLMGFGFGDVPHDGMITRTKVIRDKETEEETTDGTT